MASKDKMSAVLDLRGLDMVTPVDLLAGGRTPFSKNFRLFAQQADDRRVAVSSRKGPGHYISPLGGTLSASNTASTGASTAKVGIVTGIHAQAFSVASTDRITRVDVQVSNVDAATGPLMVQIWSDASGPSKLLAESSILSGDISGTAAYCTARFVNAVKAVSGATYWIVLRMQDDGKNVYTLSTTTAGTHAWASDSSLSALTEQSYGINFKVYTAYDKVTKGAYRFNRDNGNNRTLTAIDQTMYYIDESTKTLVPLVDGLSSQATEYRFTNGDNKVFWVNSYDQLTAWDGTFETTNANKITNPDFETNTSGWTAQASPASTITRSTAEFHSGVASLSVTAASGVRGAYFSATNMMLKNRRYKLTFWGKSTAPSGFLQFAVNASTPVAGLQLPITSSWQKYEVYYTPPVDVNQLYIQSSGSNFFLDDVAVVDTGIEYIIDPELPILSDVLMHKDRLWGVVAADPNKLVFSENPGNPAYDPTGVTPTTYREQWYYAWLSVSYWYVPRPHNGSPITAIVSFQDALVVFTQDSKYILGGSDRGNLNLRQSTGVKGALSRRGVVNDENRIYFVSDDGLYEFNGSSDEKISGLVNPLFDGCGHKDKITPVIWKSQVRFYMASQGSAVNDTCVIFDKDMNEMLYDTETFVDRALYYNDADDNQQLAEFSSLYPTAFYAEQSYHSVGAPIDFEYRLKYDSMGTPMQRKRLKRFYPILQGVDSTYTLQLAMDKDFEDSPTVKEQLLTVNGAKIGEFVIGDGTLLGGDKSFKPKRQSYSGYANYWQLRVKRRGVNNRVAFVGAQFSYKTKRL